MVAQMKLWLCTSPRPWHDLWTPTHFTTDPFSCTNFTTLADKQKQERVVQESYWTWKYYHLPEWVKHLYLNWESRVVIWKKLGWWALGLNLLDSFYFPSHRIHTCWWRLWNGEQQAATTSANMAKKQNKGRGERWEGRRGEDRRGDAGARHSARHPGWAGHGLQQKGGEGEQ